MNALFEDARSLLTAWKGDAYIFGRGVLPRVGEIAAAYGKKALVVCNQTYMKHVADVVVESLAESGVSLAGGRVAPDAGPNAPREDVYRLQGYILHYKPDCIVAVGGGSTIDACKAANMLAALGVTSCELASYFGVGLVSTALKEIGRTLLPLIAVQTSASSGAHLTKYSNVTDPVAGQKKLIVDEAIIPVKAVFDYDLTATMPRAVTIDGALDAVAHSFEVFCSVSAGPAMDKAEKIATVAVELVFEYAPRVIANPNDMEAREAIGMATDLGGYAIMIGGTSGPHLTSFSLVDVAGHGTACGVMNPYYLVFYAPKIGRQARLMGTALGRHGHMSTGWEKLEGRELGEAVAVGMVAFAKSIGAPTRLTDFPGFTEAHIAKALKAAKDPQLEMKLKNMPVPLTAALVDEYMEPILRAAASGDFSGIRNLA